MQNILFVTGTDTGVGKTFVSSLLLSGILESNIDCVAVKPVETGCQVHASGDLVAADVQTLKSIPGARVFNYYKYQPAVAPNVAALIAGERIDFDFICESIQALSGVHRLVLVEGAGGILVGLDESHTFADLVQRLGASILLVSGSKLGVINHTALSMELIKSRGLRCCGYVLNNAGSEQDPNVLNSNPAQIRSLGDKYSVPCLAEIPQLKKAEYEGRTYRSNELCRSVIEYFGLN